MFGKIWAGWEVKAKFWGPEKILGNGFWKFCGRVLEIWGKVVGGLLHIIYIGWRLRLMTVLGRGLGRLGFQGSTVVWGKAGRMTMLPESQT